MIDPFHLPSAVQTILVTRLDGLGDIVLGTQLLSGLHAKWPAARVLLVVRPPMAGVGAILPEWVEVRTMPFDPRLPVGGSEGKIIQQLREFAAVIPADLTVVAEYNRTWAAEILAATCGAKTVLAMDGPTGLNFEHAGICAELGVGPQDHWQTVPVDGDVWEREKYNAFLDALGLSGASFQPGICINDADRREALELWARANVQPGAIVCFPGSGEQLIRSLDPAAWGRWIAHLAEARPVVLLGSDFDQAVLDEIGACGVPPTAGRIQVPGDRFGVTAAVLQQAAAYVGMDTGPMHIAAALGRPTMGIFGGGHSARRFLPVGAAVAAIRMPLGCYGCGWHCPFDRRLCIKDIPEQSLWQAADTFLNDPRPDSTTLAPRVFDIRPPAELPTVILGPTMRQHQYFLNLNHQITEHHAFLAHVRKDQQARIDDLAKSVRDLLGQNHQRGQAIEQLNASIARLSEAVTESFAAMTQRHVGHDQSIAAIRQSITEMSQHNTLRDEAIGRINSALAEMTQVNQVRDQMLARLEKQMMDLGKRLWFVPGKKS